MVFVTFEEKPTDIVRNVQRLNWDLAGLIHAKKLVILDVPNYQHLFYHFGVSHVRHVFKRGRLVFST